MNKMQQQVLEFQRAMELPVGHRARAVPEDQKAVRHELIREELEEFLVALQTDDMVEQADALIDILYVAFGGLVVMGIDAEVLFDEVHRSNMSKFGEDGKPIIAGPNDPDGIFEGRVKKGPNYFRPNIRALLAHGVADQDLAKA
ncbi:MazG-like nucleotide pyrophosphohydrolase [Microbacterium phage Quartz]|nr:MazG-like nucleotide pyrophosphohydrolase [Microbacterium phage Quartz]